jgi:proline iminopeptidase
MNIMLLTLLMIAVFSVVFLLAVLLVLGSPSATEPRFIKAARFNMWAETLAMIGYGLLHPRLLSFRATKVEKEMAFPGDELVPRANAGATYGITIEAPADRIWPWLLQMGYRRALWYSWSPAHAFPEYKKDVSPWTIHPEWQSLKVGDVLMDGDALDQCTENKGAWRVREVQDKQAIVLFSARDFLDGIEFDPRLTRPKKIYGITSWVFHICPINDKRSRLLIRVRAELGPGPLKIIAWMVFGTGDAVFERTILDGIKTRVENYEQLNSQAG